MLLEVLNLLKNIQGLFYDNFAGTFGQISPIPGFVSSLFVGLFMADVSAGIVAERNNKKIFDTSFSFNIQPDFNQHLAGQTQDIEICDS